MPNLFGLDIAGIVDNALQSAGGLRVGTLTRGTQTTRNSTNLTGGTRPSTQAFSFRGFAEKRNEVRQGGTLVRSGGLFVSILGASIEVEPQSGDVISIDGNTFTVVALESVDPANALYVCKVES